MSVSVLLLSGLMAFQSMPEAEGVQTRLSAQDISQYIQTYAHSQKPKPVGKPGADNRGNDSCQWANDLECDEPEVGTGACEAGTDYSDCWRVIAGVEDDSCEWANDNECDEIHFGSGACAQATDVSDCGSLNHLRGREDSCESAFNGICDEGPDGLCEARTDRSDCGSRERPMAIYEHFFGQDDRQVMDTSVFPWSVIGRIDIEGVGECTATLIAPNVLVTAAHCIHDDEGQTLYEGEFQTGMTLRKGGYRAQIVDFWISDDWDSERFENTQRIDGQDWALLKLDTALGDELGFVTPLALVEARGRRQARRVTLSQAGYSWDTGTNLTGHQGCGIERIHRRNTLAHNCDTTRGDSGSPFMIEEDGQWFVIATDSNFRPYANRPADYIAARSEDWVEFVTPFANGELSGAAQLPQITKPGAKPGVKTD